MMGWAASVWVSEHIRGVLEWHGMYQHPVQIEHGGKKATKA